MRAPLPPRLPENTVRCNCLLYVWRNGRLLVLFLGACVHRNLQSKTEPGHKAKNSRRKQLNLAAGPSALTGNHHSKSMYRDSTDS